MAHQQTAPAIGNTRVLWIALTLLLAIPSAVYLFIAPENNAQAGDVVTYTTAAGEERNLRLDDGSEVHLQENSSLAVRYSDQQRRIQLTSGSIQVVVAPEVNRPFWAQAGTLRLRSDVSAFTLRLNHESVMLQVLEGEVRAQSRGEVQTIPAGQRIVLAQAR
ncbi:FecR domain-containing protein [Thalassolituus marinus]|uniref:FecR domain-containing protein n=1 Tax=Thalassolituus marinus TaxID=671053 RepID=A0ABS7ZT19_9GAMM|nr:FecR domain-containing protein [Thalassolituus marinus]MCA6064854.1 FecR domain-containing protein [Thalassolituus marinus]